jgi:DNA-binding response OmpR family regulator
MSRSQPQQAKKKILVVDDEVDLTVLCSLALEYYGFKADTSNDPNEVLSNYESEGGNLIFNGGS